ncbi:MAG TPA: O-antigen ligase family protein, partial [Candidatus Nanoarchaeia archaeon]
VSIFGVYSRFNGGLLSTISYLILYFALVTFFDHEKLFRILKILLLSSTVVAIYAILQHPTPLFRNPDGSFRGIDAGYWQQNAQVRAFSTLGHSNWLAAFMAMVIPIGFFFLIALKRFWERVLITILLITYFLAFTFTYSRGGTVGFVSMLLVLIAGIVIAFREELLSLIKAGKIRKIGSYLQPPKIGFFITLVVVGWLAVLYFFGNAFISRGVNLAAIKAEGETQLAAAGPETGKIRLIVWAGALEIFKNSPLVGSGVETFAFSYYQHRPAEHNLTSEWDFLYNKAHNEFVNYLATTGSLGFFTYILLIITFGILLLIYLVRKGSTWEKIFVVSIGAAYAGYHVQNLFSFSVVPIALLFYLTPAFFFVSTQDPPAAKLPLAFLKRKIFSTTAKVVVVLTGLLLVFAVGSMWLADFYYSQGTSSGNYSESYQNLKVATSLRPDEPLYKANLGLTTMFLATSARGKERQEKIAESFSLLNQATSSSPANVSLWRLRLQAVYELATKQPEYKSQVVESAKIVGELAPTEAAIQYDVASMYIFADQYKKAQRQLEKVVDLRFNYLDAWRLLFQVDSLLKDEEAQKKHLEEFKKYFPSEAEDEEFLREYDLI